MDTDKRVRICAYGLLAFGLLQMLADVAQLPMVKGLAAASLASPAPKVFCSVGDYETFSAQFIVHWTDKQGGQHQMLMDKHAYERLDGPYNRRNIYGAVIFYGPVMAINPATKPMLDAVLKYALCGEAPLLRELSINPDDVQGTAHIEIIPCENSSHDPRLPLMLQPTCKP